MQLINSPGRADTLFSNRTGMGFEPVTSCIEPEVQTTTLSLHLTYNIVWSANEETYQVVLQSLGSCWTDSFVIIVVVYFILSRRLYLAFSANLGLLCMPHPGIGPLV